ITNAEKEILIASPYFLPGRKLRNALMLASRRGVAVTILLQGTADHPLLQMATRALYDKLLGAGITIYEYLPAMLHGKVAVIDGCWATVGSSNLDPFSLLLNRESNIVALDAPFAETLRHSLLDEMSRNANQLNFTVWQQRGVWLRVKSWFAYRFAQLVTGLVGVKND
ncbi:MAG: phospholipase D-like domain-containing protein, partial [Pseudomonadota bacterium]